MTVKKGLVHRDRYYDSVTLMRVTNEVRSREGVCAAVVGMGTDFNIDSLKRMGLFLPEFDGVTPNDLLVAVEAEDDAALETALAVAEEEMTRRRVISGSDYIPPTLERALEMNPEAQVVLVSVPGRYAAGEARKALEAGRHVMLFSDNVSIEEERSLKELAVSKGLLMMGPDCGTAILNGVPLAFANVVRRGSIGVVAASGTGLQEVTCLIDRFGFGISQALGVGGRDLSKEIGGLMTIECVKALLEDAATEVIVIVSKPPAPEAQKSLFRELEGAVKPIVIYFIGADRERIEEAGFVTAGDLEETASRAVEILTGEPVGQLVPENLAREIVANRKLPGPFVRGLYSGGTFCDEAQRKLMEAGFDVYSNTPAPGARCVEDLQKSVGHTILDLGDDDFTRGRAHPMIDPAERIRRLEVEFADDDAGLILFDVVLGYGSHPDMGGAMAAAIRAAREKSNREPLLFCNLCGTESDPQGFDKQRKVLEEAGVVVFPSHASMLRTATELLSGKNAFKGKAADHAEVGKE